jgi:hypothetical protein
MRRVSSANQRSTRFSQDAPVVDWVVAAILAVLIATGVDFHH